MLVGIKYVTRQDMEGKIFCLEAIFPSREEIENPSVAYKATCNPDTIYLHEAMKDPDADNFDAKGSDGRNGKQEFLHYSKVRGSERGKDPPDCVANEKKRRH
jgi:hypothetical protein